MKKIKKIAWVLICLVCVLSCTVQVQAAYMNVTKTMNASDKKQMKRLAMEFTNVAGYSIAYEMSVGGTKTLDCSKIADRRTILSKGDLGNRTVDELSQYLFGKNTSKATNVVGDWGESAPELKCSKISQSSTNSDKYCILYTINWHSYLVDKIDKVGTMKIYVKAKKGSHYGYVVTKVVFSKKAELPVYEDLPTVDYSPYNRIVDKYAVAFKEKWPVEKLDKKYMSPLIQYTYGKDPQEEGIGFLPRDLDGDGIYELLIANITRDSSGPKEIYAAYTLNNGKAKRVLLSSERDRYYLLITTNSSKGVIAREASNSAFDSALYELSFENGDFSVVNGIIWHSDSEGDTECYESKDYDWDVTNDEFVGVAYAKAVQANLQSRYDIPGCLSIDQGFFIPDPEVQW